MGTPRGLGRWGWPYGDGGHPWDPNGDLGPTGDNWGTLGPPVGCGGHPWDPFRDMGTPMGTWGAPMGCGGHPRDPLRDMGTRMGDGGTHEPPIGSWDPHRAVGPQPPRGGWGGGGRGLVTSLPEGVAHREDGGGHVDGASPDGGVVRAAQPRPLKDGRRVVEDLGAGTRRDTPPPVRQATPTQPRTRPPSRSHAPSSHTPCPRPGCAPSSPAHAARPRPLSTFVRPRPL